MTIDVKKNIDTGLYDPSTVRANLIAKIGGANAAV
jgi:hypothetical protein